MATKKLTGRALSKSRFNSSRTKKTSNSKATSQTTTSNRNSEIARITAEAKVLESKVKALSAANKKKTTGATPTVTPTNKKPTVGTTTKPKITAGLNTDLPTTIGTTAVTTPMFGKPETPLQTTGVEAFINANNPSTTGTFQGPQNPNFTFAANSQAPASGAPSASEVPITTGTDREAQIKAIQEEANRIQESFNKLKAEQQSKLDAAVVSDEPVVNEEESALDSISYESPTTKALELLTSEIERLEDIYKEDKRAISADYRSQQTSMENKQGAETGQLSVGLANAGGYLGYSGSGQGMMLSLAKSHREELLGLEAQRQQAIREARTASENRRFDLVREKAAEIVRIDQEAYAREQDYIANKMKLQNEELGREEKIKLENDIFAQIQSGKKTVNEIYQALGGTATVEDITNALTGFIPETAGGFKFSANDTGSLIGTGMSQADIVALNEVLNTDGYTDAVKNALTASQRYAVEKILNGTTAAGTGTALGKPMTVLDLDRLEESYGVRFPYGITQAEVTTFFEETKGMTPEEQQAIIDSTVNTGSSSTGKVFTKDYLQANYSTVELKALADKTGASSMWTGKETDIARMFDNKEYMDRLNELVTEARNAGYADDEIIDYLTK